MTVLLLCLGLAMLAVAIVLSAPAVLVLGRWQVRHPRLALSAWTCAVGMGALAAVASVASALAAGIGLVEAGSGGESVAMTIVAWALLFGVAAVVALVATTSEHWDGPAASLQELVDTRDCGELHLAGRSVLVVDSMHPMACSLTRPEAVVIVSTALTDLLSAQQLAAVVEHERAHIEQRHHLVRELAEFQCACMPWLPAARALDRATRLLVELVADDVAARRAGAVHLTNALARLGEASGDATMTLRAERLAARSWRPGRGAVQARSRAV